MIKNLIFDAQFSLSQCKFPLIHIPFGFHSNPIDENWYSGISFEEEDYPPVTAYPSRRLAWAL